jgi:hypothetical protein
VQEFVAGHATDRLSVAMVRSAFITCGPDGIGTRATAERRGTFWPSVWKPAVK